MEFGFVRQKIKFKNPTRVPTVQTGAKEHHLQGGTISGSWTRGPGAAPGPPPPVSRGGGQGGKQLSGQEWGDEERGRVRATPSPHGKKNY